MEGILCSCSWAVGRRAQSRHFRHSIFRDYREQLEATRYQGSIRRMEELQVQVPSLLASPAQCRHASGPEEQGPCPGETPPGPRPRAPGPPNLLARALQARHVSKLALLSEGSLGGGGKGPPKTGLLMALLGVIFMKGNRATEEVWEFLTVLGVQAGRGLLSGLPPAEGANRSQQREFLGRSRSQVSFSQAIPSVTYYPTLEADLLANSSPPFSLKAIACCQCKDSSRITCLPLDLEHSNSLAVIFFMRNVYDSNRPWDIKDLLGAQNHMSRSGSRGPRELPPNHYVHSQRAGAVPAGEARRRGAVAHAALLKLVSRKYREHFPEILTLTSERMELVFGLELREADARSQTYILVSKLALLSEGSLGGGGKGPPKTGLLMALLGVIFMKGNHATEEEVWEFLTVLGVQAGRRHPIFGEPRKLITEDLVRQGYLEYRPVPASDPPRHKFLWGPRAREQTSKMHVLQVLAKIKDTVPRCFPQLYEEALLEEEERAAARGPRRV
ncbi:hypothetical protein PANDA_008162 [Ailuropoda melanoleuca]|uniref:MAGE domain-containing protein n=1 Tax=Ailuropoda melanoleuca TaxID=9646 RepID=D2HC67_AILME|nr:hypothetical protein PANDA_008162 [Ailuropoda melanoleuca]